MNNTQSEEDLFLAALEITNAEQRTVYLDAACAGDAPLRRRVEALLRRHQESVGPLDAPPPGFDATADHPAIAEGPGTVIGPYKLLQQIGEGGMGVVFMAEQTHSVHRTVALKIIKPGMDTRQVIARFEAERQALAMMDHPNIAKVLDAGATDNGRQYFVMELVQGVPITEYCDQCSLTTRERLELFITAGQAVQHAHQKGVIHRDLKPTNVLVAMQDSRPAPKIIDFGVAKALNQRLTEHTLATGYAQMIGTPLYMSPEQAELSPLGVDTRSDIYSLGVLLYELLTGTTPFDKERLHAAGYDELRRIIRDEDPPRPSTRISTLVAAFSRTVAEHRRTDTRRLMQAVRGELDWIVMKCLEKVRDRRYDSATALIQDVRRYLNNEPVLACPPSKAYYLKKVVQRNKMAVVFVTLLLAGAGLLIVSNFTIRRERDAKTAALHIAQENEQLAMVEASNFREISALLQDMLASSNPDRAKGADYTVRQLLDEFSLDLGDRLASQPQVLAAIHATIGRAYWRLGLIDEAEPHLQQAVEIRRRVLGSNHELVAESLVDQAWNRAERLHYQDALSLLDEALSIYRHNNSSAEPILKALWAKQRFLTSQHKYQEAEATADEALAIAGNPQSVRFPVVANILHTLADGLIILGRSTEAEQAAQTSVALHRRLRPANHPEIAWGLLVLGRALTAQKKYTPADSALRESIDIFQTQYGDDYKGLREARVRLARVQISRGEELKREAEALLDSGKYSAAVGQLQKTLANIGADRQTFLGLAVAHWRLGSYDEAGKWYRAALRRHSRFALPTAHSLDLATQASELIRFDSDEDLNSLLHNVDEALNEYSRAIEHDPVAAWAYQLRGQAFADTKRFGDAEADYMRALELIMRNRDLPIDDVSTANAFGDDSLSNARWDLMAAVYSKLIDLDPSYYRSYQERGYARLKLQDYNGAVTDYTKSIELNPQHGQQWMRRGIGFARLGQFEQALQDMNNGFDRASAHAWNWPWTERAGVLLELERWKDAIVDLEAMAAANPDKLEYRYQLALASVANGDVARYRTLCAELLASLQTRHAESRRLRILWLALLFPNAVEDPHELVVMAERVTDSQIHDAQTVVGAALLRAHRFDQAIEYLLAAHQVVDAKKPKTSISSPATVAFLLTIAYCRAAQSDEGRDWFRRASAHAINESEAAGEVGYVPNWERRLTLTLLSAEAEALINGQRSD